MDLRFDIGISLCIHMVAGANSSAPLTTPLLQRLTPSIYFLNDGLKAVLRKMSNGFKEKQFEIRYPHSGGKGGREDLWILKGLDRIFLYFHLHGILRAGPHICHTFLPGPDRPRIISRMEDGYQDQPWTRYDIQSDIGYIQYRQRCAGAFYSHRELCLVGGSHCYIWNRYAVVCFCDSLYRKGFCRVLDPSDGTYHQCVLEPAHHPSQQWRV